MSDKNIVWLGIEDAAQVLGVSSITLRRKISEKKINYKKLTTSDSFNCYKYLIAVEREAVTKALTQISNRLKLLLNEDK